MHSITTIRKELVLNFYELCHLLLLIEHKWNVVPYTRKLLLCPEAAVHPTRYVEDVNIEGSSCYDEASKHVVKRVSELIDVEMLKNEN